MSELPEVLAVTTGHAGRRRTPTEWLRAIHALRALIAELEAELKDYGMKKRREVALLIVKLEKADATAGRLKCCGNCKSFDIHHAPYGDCEQGCEDYLADEGQTSEWPNGFARCEPYDPCHFTSSRWTARAQAGSDT